MSEPLQTEIVAVTPQVTAHIANVAKAIAQAGDEPQQRQIDANTSKVWLAIISAVAAGIVSIAAAVIPMVRTPVNPDTVQKVFITNWPGTPGAPSGLSDDTKKALREMLGDKK